MIQITLTNEIMNRIMAIEEQKFNINSLELPMLAHNRLRKISKKKSAYASAKIEGNPLTEEQAYDVIEQDAHKHFLRPEQEIRNYYLALNYLDEQIKNNEPFSLDLILEIQKLVEKVASPEKIGLRGAMPPGTLFAVYDSVSGAPEYIPPEYKDVPMLLDELVNYVQTTDDHPILIAAVVHYQLVTIHPFEDGNGRTARLMSGYILDYYGYGFQGIGSLEEYFAYDPDEYYAALQMGLPALYYDGRESPPHPEIWIHYFLRMMELYVTKVSSLSLQTDSEAFTEALSHINSKEKQLLKIILENNMSEVKPIELSRIVEINNKTVIKRLSGLCQNGFMVPIMVRARIRTYIVSEFTKAHKVQLLEIL